MPSCCALLSVPLYGSHRMSLSKYQQELLEKEIENCRLKVQLSEMETHLVKKQQVKIEQLKTELEQKNAETEKARLKTELEQKNTEIVKAQLEYERLELPLRETN